MINTSHQRGFTLIELLLAMGIMSVLLTTIVIAINPVKQIADSRDNQRSHDVHVLLNALYQYSADNEGNFPSSVEITQKEICRTGAPSCVGLIDIAALVDNQTYLVGSPIDPLCTDGGGDCGENGTGYWLAKTAGGQLHITATSAENIFIDVIK